MLQSVFTQKHVEIAVVVVAATAAVQRIVHNILSRGSGAFADGEVPLSRDLAREGLHEDCGLASGRKTPRRGHRPEKSLQNLGRAIVVRILHILIQVVVIAEFAAPLLEVGYGVRINVSGEASHGSAGAIDFSNQDIAIFLSLNYALISSVIEDSGANCKGVRGWFSGGKNNVETGVALL
jgi:hypothetical protein